MRKTIVLQVFDWDKITKADGIGEVKCEVWKYLILITSLTGSRSKFLCGR